MSIFFPPPPPFTGGAQPYDNHKLPVSITSAAIVNNPPFQYGGPLTLIHELAALNQPTIWPYVYFGNAEPYAPALSYPNSLFVTVNNPPVRSAERSIAAMMESVGVNQPNPWVYAYFGSGQPYVGSKLTPTYKAPDAAPIRYYGGTPSFMMSVVGIAQQT